MKVILRVLIGLVGIVAIVLGVRQFSSGIREISAKPAIQSQKMGETFVSKQNGYSHRIPLGWESKPPPPSAVEMFVAPKRSALSSNMLTTVESFAGSLLQYVEANKQALRITAPGAKFVNNDSDFVTNAGVTGHKLKLQNKVQDVDLVQTMYFFQGASDSKIIVTCTAPVSLEAQLETLFDDCMKTFALSAR
jgi:hypothetical protein